MKTLNSLFTRERLVLLFILLFFGLIFSSISLVNHYFFRSNAFDMGWYNKTIFDYSRLRFCDFTLGIRHVKCVLGDHFELYPLLFAPLRLLFGSWTLLIIQLLSVLFGSYGIYIYFRFRTERKWLPFLAMLFFLSTWGVYAALSFDYHNNLVGAMLIPWFFHFFEKGNTPNRREHLNTWFFFVLILVSKEPMAFFRGFASSTGQIYLAENWPAYFAWWHWFILS